MRVVFDHQIFGWQEYGGISRYIYELAIGLSIEQVNSAVVCPFYINRYLADGQPNFKLIGIRAPKFNRCGRVYRAINAVLARPILTHLQPDIVHETYYSSLRTAPKNAKIVLTVHDMIHERFPDCYSSFDPTSKEKAAAVKRADHIICVSEHTRKDLIELLGVSTEKTSVVHHGFRLSVTPFVGKIVEEVEQRPFLLYVGRRDGYKNFSVFIQAYARASWLKREFDVVCFGGDSFTKSETELFRALGLSLTQVRQLSGDDALLASYYRKASALVYPSLYEGFGIPPLEAMSFACPVVCSNTGPIPEVVGDAAEMFDPLDGSAIVAAIERVVGDETLRNTLIQRGMERIKLFNWGSCTRQTLEVYRHLMN